MEHSGPTVAQRGHLRVIDCAECGYAHLSELPDDCTLARYYASEFWSGEKKDALLRIEAQRAWLEMMYGDWLDAIDDFVRPASLLDIGCGFGHFLAVALGRGWRCDGIEPSNLAAGYASMRPGITVHNCTWEMFPASGRLAVAALWLLEHLPRPVEFLAYVEEALVPGGVLLLVVPNERTRLQRMAEAAVDSPGYWIHHTHCNYFSWETVVRLVEAAGLEVVDRMGTYPMEDFLLAGRDYTRSSEVGRECHREIEAIELEMPWHERQVASRERGQAGDGRDIVLLARKP